MWRNTQGSITPWIDAQGGGHNLLVEAKVEHENTTR